MMVEENHDPFSNSGASSNDFPPEPESNSAPGTDLNPEVPTPNLSAESLPQDLESDRLSAQQTLPAPNPPERPGLFSRIGKLFQGGRRPKSDPMILPVTPPSPTPAEEPAQRSIGTTNKAEAALHPDTSEGTDLSGRFEMVSSAEDIPFERPAISRSSTDDSGETVPAAEPEQNPFTIFQDDESSLENGVAWVDEPISFDQPIETFEDSDHTRRSSGDVPVELGSALDANSIWPDPFSTNQEAEPAKTFPDGDELNQRLSQDGFFIPPQDVDWAARRHMTWEEMHGTTLGDEVFSESSENSPQTDQTDIPDQGLKPEEISPEDINPLGDYSAWSTGPDMTSEQAEPNEQGSTNGVFSTNQAEDGLYEALFSARDTLMDEPETEQPGAEHPAAASPVNPPSDSVEDFSIDRLADFTGDVPAGVFSEEPAIPTASPQEPERVPVFEFPNDQAAPSGDAFIGDEDLEDAILDRLNQAVEPVATSKIVSPRPAFTHPETESPFKMDDDDVMGGMDARNSSGVDSGDLNPLDGFEDLPQSRPVEREAPDSGENDEVDPWENRSAARIQDPWSMPTFTRETYNRRDAATSATAETGSETQRVGRTVTTYSPVRPVPADVLAPSRRQPKAGESEIKAKPSLKPLVEDVQEWTKNIDRKKVLKITGLVVLCLVVLAGLIVGALWAIQAFSKPAGTTIESPIVDPSLRTYPIGVRLTGGWMIYLQKGTLIDGKWDPQGSEWLDTTEIRRVVAIPWSKQVDAVVQTLAKGDEIELFMSNNDIVKYKVDSVSKIPRSKVDILNSKQPSLVIILYQKDDSDRWVVICKP